MNASTRRDVFAMPVLRLKDLRARAVVLKLKRTVVARIATITEWPLILIDLYTEEGIVGRSYLEPYTTSEKSYHQHASYVQLLRHLWQGTRLRAIRPFASLRFHFRHIK
jgi:hypothetical protein